MSTERGGKQQVVWERLDGPGTDIASVNTQPRLVIHGAVVATRPLPYLLRYSFGTDAGGASDAIELDIEGGSWHRWLRMSRTGKNWRVVTEDAGSLDHSLTAAGLARVHMPGMDDSDRLEGVLDVRVAALPASLTPLLRRVRPRPGQPAVQQAGALVLVPSLTVLPTTPTVSMTDESIVEIDDDGHLISAEVDDDGIVRHYPGLARRIA